MPKFFLSAARAIRGLDVTALPSSNQQPSTVNITGHHLGGGVALRPAGGQRHLVRLVIRADRAAGQ